MTELAAQLGPVVDHLDIHASGALYRVLLLASTLQVDLLSWPHAQPLAGGAPVDMLFGKFPTSPVAAAGALEQSHSAVRVGWWYALHLRSALGRGRWWQALLMLQSVRDVVVGLEWLVRTHPSKVEFEPLSACFEVVARLLLQEAERHGVHVAADLTGVVVELARPGQGPTS